MKINDNNFWRSRMEDDENENGKIWGYRQIAEGTSVHRRLGVNCARDGSAHAHILIRIVAVTSILRGSETASQE
jgi:hypothetical protein